MTPPYSNPKFNYSHLSISITASGQITLIAEPDAKWRLAGPTTSTPTFTTSSNQDALDRIKGRPPTTSAPILPSATPAVSSTSAANREAIDKIRAATRPISPAIKPPTSSTPNIPPRQSSPQSSNQGYRSTQLEPPPREKGVVEKILGWLFR